MSEENHVRRILSTLTAFYGVCLCLPSCLPAQAVAAAPTRRLTLADALDRLEGANLDLRLARSNVGAAGAQVTAAGVRPNPAVAAEHQQLTGYYETTLQASQALERGGQRRLRIEAAERSVAAAEVRVDAERLRLGFEVRRAYIRALAAEARLTALGEAADVFRRGERAGQVQLREGDISSFALQRLRLERARYDGLLARVRLDLGQAGRDLATLVAPDSLGAGLLILPAERLNDGSVAPPIQIQVALARAAERPDVRAAEAEVAAARADVELQRALRRPPVTVSGGLRNQSDGARGVLVGASMPLPVRNRNQGNIAIAEAALAGAEVRRALVLRRAENEVRRAIETRAALAGRIEAIEQDLLAPATRLLRTARVAYAEGEMPLVELLDAADAYRSARETAIDLQAEYLVAGYDLQRAVGSVGPLTSVSNP